MTMRTENMTDRARLVFRLAEKRARQLGSATIEPEHVLLGLISEETGIGGVALRRLGGSHEQFLAILPPAPDPLPELPAGPLPWSADTDAVIERAHGEKVPLNRNFICTEHLVLALSESNLGKVPAMLRSASLTARGIRPQVMFLLQNG
jgi:ATP-dependent Clp protease ATP-binding subunit ClpA